MVITFEKIKKEHRQIIFNWLAEPHMQEFWDNSPEHKEDIDNFIQGRPTPSHYFDGCVSYWIGSLDAVPFCFILTSPLKETDPCPEILAQYRSTTGATYCLDFGIGNQDFLGKGLSVLALTSFVDFFRQDIDVTADTFFIDPDENNPRAQHVYQKAGFEKVGDFIMDKGVFEGQKTFLMMKKFFK